MTNAEGAPTLRLVVAAAVLSFKRLAPAGTGKGETRPSPTICRGCGSWFVVPDCGLIQFRVPWSAYLASDGLTVGPDLLPESPGTLL